MAEFVKYRVGKFPNFYNISKIENSGFFQFSMLAIFYNSFSNFLIRQLYYSNFLQCREFYFSGFFSPRKSSFFGCNKL